MEIKKQKAPGKKLLKNMSLNTKWLITAILGLLLISYGLCVLTQAGNIFYIGSNSSKAIVLGLYSLLVLNGGLLIFGQAILFRTKMVTRQIVKKELKKRQKRLQESKPLVPTKMVSDNNGK